MTVDQALPLLDGFLNSAFMAGLVEVRVVHGKGSGKLRGVIHREIAHHPLVESFRLGVPAEGGLGVTVIRLVPRG